VYSDAALDGYALDNVCFTDPRKLSGLKKIKTSVLGFFDGVFAGSSHFFWSLKKKI